MMVIATRLGDDAYGGTGVFAAAEIAAGTVVWKRMPYIDTLYTERELAAMPDEVQAFFNRYCYPVFDEAKALRGYEINLDNGRFVNHSETPNMVDVAHDPDLMVAARDIACGEELTCDYRLFGEDLGF